MLFWLVLGWVVWRIGRQHLDWRWLWFGLLIMWLAPLTKVIALLAIPFFAIASWRVLPTWRDRLILAFVTAMSYAASAVLIFLPFGSVATYIARLANEATGGVSFSPVAMVILATRALGYSFNFGGIGPYLLVGLALVAFVLGILTWWPGRNPERGAADLLFAYTVQAFNFRLWYTTWLFPFLLLDGIYDEPNLSQERRLQFGLWFLLGGQLVVFFFSHGWHLFGRDHLWTHVLGVPFVFVLPFILVWCTQRWFSTIRK